MPHITERVHLASAGENPRVTVATPFEARSPTPHSEHPALERRRVRTTDPDAESG